MASRTFYFVNDEGKTLTTEEVGDKIDFTQTSGVNEPFGVHTPTMLSVYFDSSAVYANFSGSVMIEWELRLKINGAWYSIYDGRKYMSVSNSDFSAYNIELSSTVSALLQSYSISKIALYHAGDNDYRGITAKVDATGYCTIEYEEGQVPTLTAPGNPVIEQSADQYLISWSPASASNGDPSDFVTYEVLFSDYDIIEVGTESRASVQIPSECYGVEMAFAIKAKYGSLETTSEWVLFKAEKPAGGTMRCFIGGEYRTCLVYVYKNSSYKSAQAYVYDGEKWLSGSAS